MAQQLRGRDSQVADICIGVLTRTRNFDAESTRGELSLEEIFEIRHQWLREGLRRVRLGRVLFLALP